LRNFVQLNYMQRHGRMEYVDLTQDQTATVYVIDADPRLGVQVERMLSSPDYLIKTFTSVGDFLESRDTEPLSCMLVGCELPDADLAVREQSLGNKYCIPMVCTSTSPNVRLVAEVMRNGAIDFLEKPLQEDLLKESVTRALNYASFLQRKQQGMLSVKEKIESLSARELEVLQLVVSGWLNKQIAAALQITERTVKAHRGNIMSKMEVDSLAALVALAVQAGLGSVEPYEGAPLTALR